jgi:hypothetical protein
MPRSVFLARDGSAWGYVTRTAVVTAQGKSATFDDIRAPEFSPDLRRVSFAGRQKESWYIVVDNRKIEAPGLVGNPMWSTDGRTVGYGVLLGRALWWKVITIE